MDHNSFLLIKEKIIDTDKLINKCQSLQEQLEAYQKDQAKQQMELKILENENALLSSEKRKIEAEISQKTEEFRGYENSMRQFTAKITEYEKLHEKDLATIKEMKEERDSAASEKRKVNRRERKSVKARSKGTQTELIVQVDNNSRIIIPSHHIGSRQRRRSQATSRSDPNEGTTELRCVTPTRSLVAPEAATFDSSCSEDDNDTGGEEDITEKEMAWLTQLSEQPSVTSSHDITNTDSELDDSFLLPYSMTEMSISPLPPTPCTRLNDNTTAVSGDEGDISMVEECRDVLQDDGDCWSPAGIEQATLFSSLDLDSTTEQSSGTLEPPIQGKQERDSKELPLQGIQELQKQELPSQGTQELPSQGTQELPLPGTQELLLQQMQEFPLQGTQNESPCEQSSSQVDYSVHQPLSKDFPSLLVTNSSNSESANSEAGIPEVSILEASQSETASPIIDFSSQQQTTVNASSSGVHSSAIVGKSPRVEVSKLPVEIRRSPSFEAPELVISVSPSSVVDVTAKLPVVDSPVEVTKELSFENDQSSESIPVFVSQAPTGLTSPVALRPNTEASSKRDLLGEDQVVKEKSTKKLNEYDVSGDKNRFIVAPRHTSSPLKKRKQRQLVDAEFSLSIAERTRSRAKGDGQSVSSFLKKPVKRESRELNRLVVDMNGYERITKNNIQRKRKSLNKFRKINVKKCRDDIDCTGDNSVNFEPQQEQQQQQSSSQVNNRFTEPKLSNGQLKLPQTDKDDLSCGSKSEGEIESEEDDELDSTVTSTSDPTLVPEPSTPPDSPVLPSPCTEATTMSSLPGIRKDTQHVMSITSFSETGDMDTELSEDVFKPHRNLLEETALPGWLEWGLKEEEDASKCSLQRSYMRTQQKKNRDNRNKHQFIIRSIQQKLMDYILTNLERMFLNKLDFDNVVNMFADPRNVNDVEELAIGLKKFILEAFHPSFEVVSLKLKERCNKAVCHNAKLFPHYKPLDENFHAVMLKFEARLVAMVVVLERHNPKFKNMIGYIAEILCQAVMTSLEDNRSDVHKQCALIRVLSGISRAGGLLHYMQQFCLDLISAERPLTINQLPMLQSVVGVWPLVLSRKIDAKLYVMKEILPDVLEQQMLPHTVEVVTCYLISRQDPQGFTHLLFKTFISFCKWQPHVHEFVLMSRIFS
ncbi:uro-adherence factor A-like isoform X2 [Dysidea avara]|uniref:uro-adherence factor A-like isoform X2 n=1 Tax=Dysidea avara TaxID=196820 RepID=UPI00332E1CB2